MLGPSQALDQLIVVATGGLVVGPDVGERRLQFEAPLLQRAELAAVVVVDIAHGVGPFARLGLAGGDTAAMVAGDELLAGFPEDEAGAADQRDQDQG